MNNELVICFCLYSTLDSSLVYCMYSYIYIIIKLPLKFKDIENFQLFICFVIME